MLTLLEYQEALRNMSDPDLDQVLSSDPRNKWMAVDEVKRRKVDREAEKAKLAESRMHPSNMLEEYQAELQSGMVGGHDLYGASSQDPSLRGSMDPYSEMEDPFSQGGEGIPVVEYQEEPMEFALGLGVPYVASRLAPWAAGAIPWLVKKFGPKKAKEMAAKSGTKIPDDWVQGPFGMRMPPPAGGPTITTPVGKIPGQLAPSSTAGGAAGSATEEAVKQGWMRRHPVATAALGVGGYQLLSGGDDDDQPDRAGMLGSEAPEPPTGALSTFEKMYLDQMQQTREGQLEVQKQLEDAKLSGREKLGRILLRAGGGAAMAGDQWVGGLLTGASEAIAEITEEERARLNELIALYRAGELSQAQLMGAFADLQASRARSGKPPLTQSQFINLTEQGLEDEDIINRIGRYQSLFGGRQGPAHDGVAVDYRNDYNDQGIRRR